MTEQEYAQAIYQAALDCGFDNCGIISPEALMGYKNRIQERMENVPASAGFYQGMLNFGDVAARFPWGKSLVICVYEYGKYRYPEALRGHYGKAFLLSPEKDHTDGYDRKRFEGYLTSLALRWQGGDPFPLRYAAMAAGLGIIRRNNFFYTENGSYVNLTGYIIDQKCERTQQAKIRPCAKGCNLCQRACKSHALSGAYTMNPGKCISFWTTFGKGHMPEFLNDEMFEGWLCGCDNCQDACPYNRKHNWNEGKVFSDLEMIASEITPDRLLDQTDEYLQKHVIPKTDNHLQPEDTSVLRQNAKRALRNRGDCL